MQEVIYGLWLSGNSICDMTDDTYFAVLDFKIYQWYNLN